MDRFVRIARIENEFESHVVGHALKEAGIPSGMQSFHDSAYDGVFQAQEGWGCVMGRPEDQDAIERIIADVRAHISAEDTND